MPRRPGGGQGAGHLHVTAVRSPDHRGSGFLDAYTFLVRGGVFANAQTGNVILLAVNLAHGEIRQASAHLWPIIAFVAALQIELFRSIGNLNYIAVATTGNLMRWVEA